MMDTRSNKVNGSQWYYENADLTTQTDTLIVWTESNGTDMALSFQEADGCAVIWFVNIKTLYLCISCFAHIMLGNSSVRSNSS
jgi:hypothetical protein